MNRIHSNIKKIALSLLLVGLAIFTQAYKSAEKAAKLVTIYYGFNSSTGNYELINGMPNSGNCATFGSQECVVEADSEDGLEPTLTVEEVETLGLQAWEESSSNSRYIF